MIKINIGTEKGKVYDSFTKKEVNMQEVAVVLLRLKQIEQQLLAIEFDSIIEIDGEDKK